MNALAVTPDEVRALKRDLDPVVRSLEGVALERDEKTRLAWAEFAIAWHAYVDAADTWWNAPAEMHRGEAFARELQGWQSTLDPRGAFVPVDFLPKLWAFPSEVRALKARVDPVVRSMDHTVATCAALPAAKRQAWQLFSNSWRIYFDGSVPFFESKGRFSEGEALQAQLHDWQESIGEFCTLDAPPIAKPGGSTLEQTIKTVIIGGAVIAAGLAVYAVAK
jgi:hypothetical protein